LLRGDKMRVWLKNIREAKMLSQAEVAKMANISQQYYSKIENGNTSLKLPVVTTKKIADVLEFEWTLFYSDENQNSKERYIEISYMTILIYGMRLANLRKDEVIE
jgi:transcriptional regulator with XRE-family HTH domain